jgi:DNA-binding NarL/FixJ family response regulator
MEAAGGWSSAADRRSRVSIDLQHDRATPEAQTYQGHCRTTNGEPGPRPARPTGAATPLTTRELSVLDGLAAGFSDREIALRLMLFERAVRAVLQSIYRKLGVHRREEAVYAPSRVMHHEVTSEGIPMAHEADCADCARQQEG